MIWFQKKVKAGALQYVVLLSLLIFFLIGMFMLRAQYSNYQVNELIVQERLYDNLESAKVLLKSNASLSQSKRKFQLKLFQDDHSLVDLIVENWGVFKIAHLRASWRQHMREQYLLLGDNIWKDGRPSLYLADKNRYLSVCGETWLGGPVNLPALGVRKSYVDGVGYYRSKAIQGEIRRSEKNLPPIKSNFSALFNSLFVLDYQKDSVVLWEDVSHQKLSRSFAKKALFIWSPDVLVIDEIEVKGKVKIMSLKEIVVGSNAKLAQCLLIAPKVRIEQGFTGRVQIFARDSVLIHKNCQFFMPSVVYMHGNNAKKELQVASNVRFSGDIVLTGKNEKFSPSIKIDKNSRVEGLIYCNGKVELKGDVAGSLYTDRFVLQTPSALYENHLLNNRIDFSDLNSSYVGVSWFSKVQKKQILECLH